MDGEAERDGRGGERRASGCAQRQRGEAQRGQEREGRRGLEEVMLAKVAADRHADQRRGEEERREARARRLAEERNQRQQVERPGRGEDGQIGVAQPLERIGSGYLAGV